jgi:hypothetical protein
MAIAKVGSKAAILKKLRNNRWAKREMRRGGDGETKGSTVKFIRIFVSKSVSCPSSYFYLPSRSSSLYITGLTQAQYILTLPPPC